MSFTRAAAELHVSQSALTVQVKQLEEELSVLLFDRNKRGVAITAPGRDLMGQLQRLVLDSEAIVGYARDISAEDDTVNPVPRVPDTSGPWRYLSECRLWCNHQGREEPAGWSVLPRSQTSRNY